MSTPWALARYQAIAAYIATQPERGQRGLLLAQLAARSWPGPDGAPFHVSAETPRAWVRRYRKEGLRGLEDAPQPVRGVLALTEEQVAIFCGMKREVPSRSLDRLIRIAEDLELVERDTGAPQHVAPRTRHARPVRTPGPTGPTRRPRSLRSGLSQRDVAVGHAAGPVAPRPPTTAEDAPVVALRLPRRPQSPVPAWPLLVQGRPAGA